MITLKIVDMHTHTTASDGTLSPTEIVDYAVEKGLSAIAITDHDTIDAIKEAKEYGKKYPELEIITGIEYSTHSDLSKSDIHILGYYVDENNALFINKLEDLIRSRDARNAQMIDRMRSDGLPITMEDILATSEDGVITRAHFAKAMVNVGIVKRMSKAFDKYIGNGQPYYVPREKITQKMAIDMILAAGGVPVLAHPVLYRLNLKVLGDLVKELKSYGLMGIEGIYTTYKKHETHYIAHIARENDLIITGGSDFHGSNKVGIDLAVGYGDLMVPMNVRDNIYEKHLEILQKKR